MLKNYNFYDQLLQKNNMVVNMKKNVDDIDERGVIEVPADAEVVIYQDETGQYYEVSIDELKEYDGDDGEITYHNSPIARVKTIKRNQNFDRKLPVMPMLRFGLFRNGYGQRVR